MKNTFLSLLLISLTAYPLMGNSYECNFTKKITFSPTNHQAPQKIENIDFKVIYTLKGNKLLTRPEDSTTTYIAHFVKKSLHKSGKLMHWFESDTGYAYGVSEDMTLVFEGTENKKNVLVANNCKMLD